MEVDKERFENAGEQDENGYYDYYYAGWIYRFRFGKQVLIARQYEDTPEEASFQGRQRKRRAGWSTRLFYAVPYDDPAFRQAVDHLRRHEGITRVHVLVNRYVEVDLDRL
jgi:hypothetical protein